MNLIAISGEVIKKPVFSHEYYGEKFYEFQISIKRKSGVCDTLNCIVPETMVDSIGANELLTVYGEIRTRNVHEKSREKLMVYVFVKYIEDFLGYFENDVYLHGYICKEPVYRKTPLGREITDIIVASNREYTDRSDYIPCIAWGRTALRVADMPVGTELTIVGRMQSREYIKCFGSETQETRTAYEVSVRRIDFVEESEDLE